MTVSSIEEIRSPQPKHWGLWGTIIWGAAISVIFVASQVVTVLVFAIFRHNNLSELELMLLKNNGELLSLGTFVTAIVCCGLVVSVVKIKKGALLAEYLCIKQVARKVFLKWAGLLIIFLVLSDLITFFLGRPIVPPFMSSAYATAKPVWALWVAGIIAAPLSEETFFRGFLFKGFESSFLRPVGAVLLTASLWALIHVQYDLYGMGTVFCLGILFGMARYYTGSILVPLGLHAVANLVATIEAAILG